MEQIAFRFSVPPAVRQRFVQPDEMVGLRWHWIQRFRRFFVRPFQVHFHDNTSTMISSRSRAGRLRLRLHHMFLDADDRVLQALASYLSGSSKGDGTLDRFINRNMNRVARRTPSAVRGARFDLEAIRDALSRVYFDEPVQVPVVWGRTRRTRGQRSIRLGSYSFEDRVIRVHPVLDRPGVPAWVVAGVVYHEMLHHVLGAERRNGRRLVHTRTFREREARFVHHHRAEQWERMHLPALLREAAGARSLTGRRPPR